MTNKEIVVFIGKSRIVHEKRPTELTQQEIREYCDHYNVRFVDVRRHPNRLSYVEYHFSPLRDHEIY